MDGIAPFSEEERGEIRQYCKAQFQGGNLPEELFPIHQKYKEIFRAFLVAIDRRTGSFLHLPLSGGAMEQPSKIMACWEVMQIHFTEKIVEEQKKQLKRRS